MTVEEEITGPVYEKSAERLALLSILTGIEHTVMGVGETVQDKASRHRIHNLAQSAAAQRDLLEQDWTLADHPPA
jgi:hypothetical protein